MLKVILTLDYEIHGNGDGSSYDLMVEPTYRLLKLCDEFGAKLTIMADVAEILKFKEYKDATGTDAYHYEAICEQLRHAIKTGHDVQLHVHSSYFNAKYENGKWNQDWSEYNFAGLPYERMVWMVKTGKDFLESLLKPVKPNYSCLAFRAANWSVSPSRNVVRALINNGILIDTSVFKYGYRQGLVSFDYTNAFSSIQPWRVKEDDICARDDSGKLWELPIYCEKRWIGAFISVNRIYRAITGKLHKMNINNVQNGISADKIDEPYISKSVVKGLSMLFEKHAWKADFNQCTGRQLINVIEKVRSQYVEDTSLPFILIGHSKLFTRYNESDLKTFFAHCSQQPNNFLFSRLTEFDF